MTAEGAVRLALETSAPVGSVALGLGGDVLARVFLEDRGAHAERIVPAISEVLDEAGYDRDEVEGIVVGSGPGSFTGVRVAAATAKGLGHALRRPVWALSSLAAASLGDRVLPWLAGPWPVSPELREPTPTEVAATPRYVLFDARGSRVYAACYRFAAGRLEELVPPAATSLEDVLGGPVPEGSFFAGEGALRHAARIREAGFEVLPPPAGMPTAAGLLLLLATEAPPPLEDPWAWEPDYLRASSAERERSL